MNDLLFYNSFNTHQLMSAMSKFEHVSFFTRLLTITRLEFGRLVIANSWNEAEKKANLKPIKLKI